MELTFNELSAIPVSEDKYHANEIMVQFAKAVAEARRKDFQKIRSDVSASEIKLAPDYTFHDWMFDKEFSPENRGLFHGMFIRPFLNEDDEEIVERYVEANYFFEDDENQISKQKCSGLTAAYLSETLAVSFQSSPAWLKNSLNIIIDNDDDVVQDSVYHIYSQACFSQDIIADFIESITDLDIEKSELAPSEKQFHSTHHHGENEIIELWNKIKRSPYVTSGISIEWGGNSFIKNPKKDGTIELVHMKSDRRYAIRV